MTEASPLLDRFDALPELAPLREPRSPVATVGGVPAGAVGPLVTWLWRGSREPVLVVAADPEAVWADLELWMGTEEPGLFCAADTLPFDRVPPSEEVTRRRISVLTALAENSDDGVPLVVASPAGLLRPTLPADLIRHGDRRLRRGQHIARDVVVRRLVDLGYRRVTAVSSPGDMSVRGGILDVFGLDRTRPWRAEWFGDEVDDLRAFDVDTQTSVARLDAVNLAPARELDLRVGTVAAALQQLETLDLTACRPDVREAWQRDRDALAAGAYDEGVDLFAPYLVAPPLASLLDHLGPARIVLVGGRDRLVAALHRHYDEVHGLFEQERSRGELPTDARMGLHDVATIERILRDPSALAITREPGERGDTIDLGWQGIEAIGGRMDALAAGVRARVAVGMTTIAVTRQQERVEELVREMGIDPIALDDLDIDQPVTAGALSVVQADVSAGFEIPSAQWAVWSDAELFGVMKRRGSPLARGARRAESTSARGRRRAATGRAAHQAFVIDYAPGDLVVHRDHGIGRFQEMRRVSDETGEREYMVLEYGEGDRLFVPVAHLDRVDRYVGGSDARPALSRLGTGEWERTKRRVKERTEEIARELVALYSRRELASGHSYSPDGAWQRDLEASFPFVETVDQVLVLDEIKRDMEASRPMDRVVCGDVGFGKTELAVRAAFKAASEGRQVAVLVPTTVLAQQHFITFSERLRPFPITVAQLSRFCSEDEVRAALIGLRSGGVDVVIGTHRLLQKDVEFRNLGLVIIDEEQRFGVMQKERFKSLRVAVDVLSLSATPIPRTLHMSLAGIRDLSVIQTPPEERQPIRTFVTAREEGLVREVISREMARGGQVYYLHNRVQTIEREAESLRALVPEARIAVGHGQMPENGLEAVMRAFSNGDVDVLVCTTIIESGLDIPNANTIIVNDAHRFGLAQLYQLRGRVGRSGQRAYAYLLYPPERSLTERADKRLEVIADLQDLGAGFKLAMRDLEIRGAGNLLGEEQHGEIAAVGLELYNHLLTSAVTALQGKPLAESPAQVTVSLPTPAFLPRDYVTDERLRLRCYQDLAACATETDLEQQIKGLADRFGALPEPALALAFTLKVRLLAAAAGAMAVESERATITVQLPASHGLDLESVVRQFRRWLSSSPTRLHLSAPSGDLTTTSEWREVLVSTLRELGRLTRTRDRVATSAKS